MFRWKSRKSRNRFNPFGNCSEKQKVAVHINVTRPECFRAERIKRGYGSATFITSNKQLHPKFRQSMSGYWYAEAVENNGSEYQRSAKAVRVRSERDLLEQIAKGEIEIITPLANSPKIDESGRLYSYAC